MAEVCAAARTIAYASDTTWRRVRPPPRRSLLGRRPAARSGARSPTTWWSRTARWCSRATPTRPATPSCRCGSPVPPPRRPARRAVRPHPAGEECPPLPVPWPRPALDALVGLLAAGRRRCRCSRRSTSRDCSSGCCPSGRACAASRSATATTGSPSTGTASRRGRRAALTRRVSRPDLLLLGALLHDLGKGLPGDHTVAGMAVVADLGRGWGCPRGRRRPRAASSSTTCCCPTSPRAATCTTRRPPAPSPTRSGRRGARAAARPHRGRLRGHRPGGVVVVEGRPGADLVRRTAALLAGARSRARPRSPTGRPRSSTAGPTRCRRAATRSPSSPRTGPDCWRRDRRAGAAPLGRAARRRCSPGRAPAVAVCRVAPRFGALPDWAGRARRPAPRPRRRAAPRRRSSPPREAAYARAARVPVARRASPSSVDDASRHRDGARGPRP
jgi:hypothetical protein